MMIDASRSESSEQLLPLFSALVDGTLTANELERLDERLRTDRAGREAYREFMCLECHLAEACTGPAAFAGEPDDGHVRWPSLRWISAATILVCVLASWLLLGGFGRWRGSVPEEADEDFLASHPHATAIVTAMDNAVWQSTQATIRKHGPLPTGVVGLRAGAAQVTLPSGAILNMEAPTRFEIRGENRVLLHEGKLTPFVPATAKGFTVDSPTGQVVDIGTEFAVSVDSAGSTDVFVISGEVDVNGLESMKDAPLRMTQGFASILEASRPTPRITTKPILMESFDAEASSCPRKDWDDGQRSHVQDGTLRIPIVGTPDRSNPLVRVELLQDLSAICGQRAMISYKASLPPVGDAHVGRWCALVLDNGSGAPPMATSPDATVAVLTSAQWQAGVRFHGKTVRLPRIFPRQEAAVGPYQVVITIDDSGHSATNDAGHAELALVSVTINGRQVISQEAITLGKHPRMSFQTWVRRNEGGRGFALIDDLSVSVTSRDEGSE